MVFACQENSFLTEFTSKVLSCNEAKLNLTVNEKKERLDCFEIVLDDTILFPEGGGQPSDRGTIDDEIVIEVKRRGDKAIHFTQAPIPVGKSVKLALDWERRFDHMQQHSGQHLITAVAQEEFDFATSSWWLGEEMSYIELDTSSITDEQLFKIEGIVNKYIQESRPVVVKVYEGDDPALKMVRTRGLPADHVGLVRVVTIENLENNMCCGTHVSNLSQLQLIKLLNVEKGKKGKVKLNFLVGNRILKQLTQLLKREAKLSNLLQNKGSMHVELVEKIQESAKTANKNIQALLREMAITEAIKLRESNPLPTHFTLYRKEADMDFINTFLRELQNEGVIVFLIVGEDPAGQMVIQGPPDYVKDIGPRLCKILEGKGFCKGSRYQAKVGSLKRLNEAKNLFSEYMASSN